MQISFTVDDSGVNELLERLLRRSNTLRPVMSEIGLRYERRVQESFAAEKSPDGERWQPLSETTISLGLARRRGWRQNGSLSARGRRYLRNKKILTEHGDLKGAVHHQAERRSVRIGTGGHIPYAAVHQFGVQRGYGRMKVDIPARPYLAENSGDGRHLVLAEYDRRWIIELLQDHLHHQ